MAHPSTHDGEEDQAREDESDGTPDADLVIDRRGSDGFVALLDAAFGLAFSAEKDAVLQRRDGREGERVDDEESEDRPVCFGEPEDEQAGAVEEVDPAQEASRLETRVGEEADDDGGDEDGEPAGAEEDGDRKYENLCSFLIPVGGEFFTCKFALLIYGIIIWLMAYLAFDKSFLLVFFFKNPLANAILMGKLSCSTAAAIFT